MTSLAEGSGVSALLSFTAENARSYRDEVHLSMLGTRLSADGVPRSLFPAGTSKPVRVLPAAGIFGGNASGKTTILKAIVDMERLVVTSFRPGSRGTRVVRQPFLLDPEYRERPTRFEVDLLLNGVRWIYGFEVDDERVREEYAYHWPRGRQALVFARDGDRISYGSPFRGTDRVMDRLLRHNSLLLSMAGATDNQPLGQLFEWFRSNLTFFESDNRVPRSFLTAEMARNPETADRIVSLLRAADLGLARLTVNLLDQEERERFHKIISAIRQTEDNFDVPEPSETDVISYSQLSLEHTSGEGEVSLSPEDESEGTLVWLSLIGPLIQTLDDGNIILIDELDSSLHSDLVAHIITMFQDPSINRHGAQMIFNSHDGEILRGKGEWSLGRDQVWFTEKYSDGDTKLYCLHDFSPRRDDNVHRRYFQGRYGARPVVGDVGIRQAFAPRDG